MLQKTTTTYATRTIPLDADIYATPDTPTDTPVVLYFHPGGLVGWGRDCLPPWLVQVCMQRKWPLISPSYRLLPQAGEDGLMEDVAAAYEFARRYGVDGPTRRVIACGSSGGFFAAALIAHHLPPPLALLSISGIPTFTHRFFTSSTLLTPKPIPHSSAAHLLTGPPKPGPIRTGGASDFHLAKLLPDGSKNVAYVAPPPENVEAEPEEGKCSMGELYDYFTYYNSWGGLVGGIDRGYGKAEWPVTIVVHGDDDYDVPLDVSVQMRDSLGDKAELIIAEGCPHLFELTKFIEDETQGMDAVRKTVAKLDEVVGKA